MRKCCTPQFSQCATSQRCVTRAELETLVGKVAVHMPTWEAMNRLTCFTEFDLISSGRGETKHQRRVEHDMEQKLRLFQTGQLSQPWAEARARMQVRLTGAPRRTRGFARMEEDRTMPESEVGSIRALIEEGALSNATELILSVVWPTPRTHQCRGSFGPCNRQRYPFCWL